MLVAAGSVKGSPGATSTALGLAAVWPRPVVLVEADPAGGDLAYRCRAENGGPVYPSPGLLTLGAAIRGGIPTAGVLTDHAQRLACGVDLVQGVASGAQARGLRTLWSAIADACTVSHVDVIADLGRVDQASMVLPILQASDRLLVVASTSLEAVMHLSQTLPELVSAAHAGGGRAVVGAVLVGPDARADGDCADLDNLLGRAALPTSATLSMPYDPRALERIEQGERATGRRARSLFVRAARSATESLHGTRAAVNT